MGWRAAPAPCPLMEVGEDSAPLVGGQWGEELVLICSHNRHRRAFVQHGPCTRQAGRSQVEAEPGPCRRHAKEWPTTPRKRVGRSAWGRCGGAGLAGAQWTEVSVRGASPTAPGHRLRTWCSRVPLASPSEHESMVGGAERQTPGSEAMRQRGFAASRSVGEHRGDRHLLRTQCFLGPKWS